MTAADQLLRTLLQLDDPRSVLRRLDEIAADPGRVPTDFAWLKLAAVAQRAAAASPPRAPTSTELLWAAVGMQCVICALQAVVDQPGLDAQLVAQAFDTHLPFSPAYAVAMVTGQVWDHPEIDELEQLRYLAQALPLLRTLVTAGRITPSPDLSAWLAAGDQMTAQATSWPW